MSFDKEAFLATSIEGELETSYTPLPDDDYEGFIDDIEVGEINDDPVLFLTIALTDQKAVEFMEREKPTIRETVFLDINENGGLEMGKNKNVKLGQYRAAAGQNTGKPWAPGQLRGAGPLLLKIVRKPDKDDPEKVYNRIVKVTAAGRSRRSAA